MSFICIPRIQPYNSVWSLKIIEFCGKTKKNNQCSGRDKYLFICGSFAMQTSSVIDAFLLQLIDFPSTSCDDVTEPLLLKVRNARTRSNKKWNGDLFLSFIYVHLKWIMQPQQVNIEFYANIDDYVYTLVTTLRQQLCTWASLSQSPFACFSNYYMP